MFIKKYTVKKQLLDLPFCQVFETARPEVKGIFWVIRYKPSLSFPPLVEEMSWWVSKNPACLPEIFEYWEEDSVWTIVVEELQGISLPNLFRLREENFDEKEVLKLAPKLTCLFESLHFSQIQLSDLNLFISRLHYTIGQEFKLLPSVLYLSLEKDKPVSLELAKAKREIQSQEYIQYLGGLFYYLLTRNLLTQNDSINVILSEKFQEDMKLFLEGMLSGKFHEFSAIDQFAVSLLVSREKENDTLSFEKPSKLEKEEASKTSGEKSSQLPLKKKEDLLFGKDRKVSMEELVIFTRGIGTMLQAGIPLLTALKIISEQKESPHLGNLCKSLALKLEQGGTLTSSLYFFPKAFPAYYTAMVAAGEESGLMTQAFARISIFLEKEIALMKKVRTALTYPAFLLISAIILTFGIVDFTFPHFFSLLKGFSVKVPLITRIVMEGVGFFQNFHSLLLLLGILLLLTASILAITKIYLPHLPKENEEAIREKVDGLKLKFPLVGAIIKKINSTLFCRTLAVLYANGVSFKNSLLFSQGVMNNYAFKKEITYAVQDLMAGRTVSESLTARGIFPSLVISMIALGEETGELEKALNKISDYYDFEVERALENFNSLMEPFIITILGVLIGVLILSLFLPLYQILQHIKT